MRKLIGVVLGAFFGLAASAQAATLIVADGTNSQSLGMGNSAVVTFNGIIDGTVTPGLTSRATITFLGLTGISNYQFRVALENTSSAPITSARTSVFAFGVDPFASATSGAPWSVVLASNDALSLPQFNGLGLADFDVCVKPTGSQTNNCNNGATAGSAFSGAAAQIFDITLNYGNAPAQVTLDQFAVRYQSIDGSLNGRTLSGDSGIGIGTVSVVPEPSTWIMMISGFGLLAMRLKARRRQAALAA